MARLGRNVMGAVIAGIVFILLLLIGAMFTEMYTNEKDSTSVPAQVESERY